MPTKVFKIPQLTGGVNSNTDTAHIKDDEAASLTSFVPDRRGRLRLAGEMSIHGITYDTDVGSSGQNNSIDLTHSGDDPNRHTSGYGLFYFRADHTMLSDNDTYEVNGSPSETVGGIDYFVVQDNVITKVYDSASTKWLQTRLTGGTEITSAPYVLPVFYYGDGGLRVSAAHTGGITFHRRWLGYIERKLFNYTGTTVTNWEFQKRWHQDTAKILTPSASAYSQTVGSEAPGTMALAFQTGGTFTPEGTNGLKFWVKYNDSTAGGTWEAKTYTFYGTYIYDGSQESNAFSLGFQAVTVNTNIGIGVTCCYANDNANYAANADSDGTFAGSIQFNPRITGARLYFSDPDDGDGILYHLLDVSFIDGCRKVGEAGWTAWDTLGESNHTHYECPDGVHDAGDLFTAGFAYADPPKFVTYETINGYGPYEDLNPDFNCAAMVGKRIYIGNVKVNGVIHNDRIMRSPINFEGKPQFDTFPETHFLEVGADDGDTIIQMIADGEKLVVFKENSVAVLNVGKFGNEYIEQSFKYVGIKNPCQATRTKYGVAWINATGCYLLQGGKIINLIEGKILTDGQLKGFQKNMTWGISDGSSTEKPAIAYLPREDKLLISINIDESAVNRAQDGWLYDFPMKSWSYIAGSMNTYKVRSNFINDHKGTLYQTAGANPTGTPTASDLQLYSWNTTSTSKTDLKYVTKDFNFGDPALIKKIYKVGITYRLSSATSNVKPFYSINGEENILETFVSNKGALHSSGYLTADTTALSTEYLKYDHNGFMIPADPTGVGSGDVYWAKLSGVSEGGLSGTDVYMQNETAVTGGNWSVTTGVAITLGQNLQFGGSQDCTATHSFGTAGAIMRGIPHQLTFRIEAITTNMTLRIEGQNMETGSWSTLASPSQYTDTGVQTVDFTPAASHTNYRFKFLNSGSSGSTEIDTITMRHNWGQLWGLYVNAGSIAIQWGGNSGAVNTIGIVSAKMTNNSGSNWITVTNNVVHQLQFEIETSMGEGVKVRLIDMGSSSTAFPSLVSLSTYDSNSSAPMSVHLSGDGVEGESADFAYCTGTMKTFTLHTAALNSSNRYYIVFTSEKRSGIGDIWDFNWITNISLKEVGNWNTGFLNLSSPVSCKSFQLMLQNSGTAHSSFEIRDIEIYYRTLRPKITSD